MTQTETTEEEAALDFNDILISFDTAESLYEMALNRYDNGKYQASLDCFQLLVLSYPAKAKYWFGFAASQQLLAQYQQAILSFTIASSLDTENPYPLLHQAECFFSLKYIEEGITILDKAMLLAKSYPNALTLINQIEVLQMVWKPKK